MAGKIIGSDDAIADLAALVRHIAEDNRNAAEKTGRAILQRTRVLEEFPLADRTLPEEGRAGVRELQLPPWRLIYELSGDGTVVVLRIWHAARGQPEV